MKKTLTVCMAILLLFGCLTSCNKACTHPWGTYQCDEASHRRAVACEHTLPAESGAHVDADADGDCDVCGYAMTTAPVTEDGDITTGEDALPEAPALAQILLDYETEKQAEIDAKRAAHPKVIFFDCPVEEVVCSFSLKDTASTETVIQRHAMEEAFGEVQIFSMQEIGRIRLTFARDAFTEEVYQKLMQIQEKDAQIESVSFYISSVWDQRFMPDIHSRVDGATPLAYTLIGSVLRPPEGADGYIIKTKEEYDARINSTMAQAMYDTQREYIAKQKDVYDAAFFEEYALIQTSTIVRGSGSTQVTLDNLYVAEHTAYAVIRTDEPYEGTCDMKYVSFTLCVPQSEVADVIRVITLE
jgi:hypothetical protein